jgi:hypothetical protein
MNRFFALAAALVFAAITTFADNEVITTFKDPAITCDYLIIAPKDFAGPAVALAQHRNSYKYDDVEQAKVAYLEDILTAFPGTDYKHRNVALWKGLKWAKENWQVSFKYLVLIGSDNFVVDTTDSSVYSVGLMPTWYRTEKPEEPVDARYFPVNVTDDCYMGLSYANPPTDILLATNDTGIYIGRIPASTIGQCSLYVEKVKRFDLFGPKGPWRNNVLAIADDAMRGAAADVLWNFHQASAESIIKNSLQGYSVRKRYLSAYPLDEFYEKPAAKTAIVQTINQGISWAFFYGHGNDQVLTDEYVLTTESIDWFTNDSMPFYFLSFTSRNGSILSAIPMPMSQKFLFKSQGGTIAYIASAYETYAVDNELLGQAFFSELKKNPNASLGALFARALPKGNDYSLNPRTYYLLGDPALRVTAGNINLTATAVPDSAPTAVRISVPDDSLSQINYSVSFTVRDSVPAVPGSYMESSMGFSIDSSISVRAGVFRHSVDVPLPQAPQSALKAIVYVWNDSADGRTEVMLRGGAPNAVSWLAAKNAATGRPMLRKVGGSIIVSHLQPGTSQVRIFDIRGRIVYSGDSGPNAESVTINLTDRNICSGRYLLQLRSGMNEVTLPFMHMAR